jgi:Family of unknown function (DUF6455)
MTDDPRSAASDAADGYWAPWLSMWRTNALLLVEPFDNVIRAFAERAQFLPRRMAALNLDQEKLAQAEPSTVRELVERCATCENPARCEWDLRQDPTNPAWQGYCPNAARLMALASAHMPANGGQIFSI